MAYAMSCYLQNEKSTPLINCQPVNMNNDQQKKKSALETVPNKSISNCKDPLTEDQIGYSFNNNKNNQLVPFDSEDPFQDTDIPYFHLGQIIETIEKENTISMTQSHMLHYVGCHTPCTVTTWHTGLCEVM